MRRNKKKIRFLIKKSSIHGKGLFSLKSFDPGEKIGEFKGLPAKREGMHVIYIPVERKVRWEGILKKENQCWWKALRIANEFKFINHSPTPNCEVHGKEIFALRKIKEDEEITMHYGADWN